MMKKIIKEIFKTAGWFSIGLVITSLANGKPVSNPVIATLVCSFVYYSMMDIWERWNGNN